jgi:hypothetical protein
MKAIANRMLEVRPWLWLAALGGVLVLARNHQPVGALTSGTSSILCAGDCNDDGTVTVDEVLVGVNIALGMLPPDRCVPLDTDASNSVTVDEILLAVTAALEGCQSTATRILIISPRNGDFTTEPSITVTGRVVNPPAGAMTTVNGVPAALQVDGTFSVDVPLNFDLILNPVLAELTEPAGQSVIDRARIVVGAGDSIPDGQMVQEGVALRLTDSGMGKLAASLPALLNLDSLIEPGTVVVNNFCVIDTPLGCIERVDVVVTSTSFASVSIDLDSMPAFVTAQIAVDDLVVSLEIRDSAFDCSGEATVEHVMISGNYELQPLEDGSIDVNLIGEQVIEVTGEDFMFTGGACDEDPIDDLIEEVAGDFASRFREALEEFLQDPDSDGPLDAPVAAAMQAGLADLGFAALLGESFGIMFETSYFSIAEDTDGVAFGSDALATPPPPAVSAFPVSYRVDEAFPSLTSTTPVGGAPYDVGLCVSTTSLNQMIKAVVEAGGLSLDLTELDLGSGAMPITAATLSVIIPEAASLDPNLPLTLRFRPTVPPILLGAPGPNGELADLHFAGVLVEVVSGLPGPAVVHLRAALDARAAFDLIFDETGRELRVALTAPRRDDIIVTILDDTLGVDALRLQANVATVLAQFASVISREIGAFELPMLFGLQPRGIEISRAGDYPCMFIALAPAASPE